MLSKSRISYLRSLHRKKFRAQHKEFIAEGPKIIGELIGSGWHVSGIYATEAWLKRSNIADERSVTEVSASELQRISNLKNPQEVLATVRMPEEDDEYKGENIVLLLDGISDPGNLGTIIRTADWFGIQRVICSNDSAELYNPKVIQSTMGSFLRVRVSYQSLTRWLPGKGLTTYGAFMEGEPVYQISFEYPAAIVIGNESNGISPELEKLVDRKISIPSPTSSAESLNASVAAGIIMSEISR